MRDVATNLPHQLTSFIGRERDLSELQRLLSLSRLITLCGPGGCGKTRLALQVAGEALERFADGESCWLVLPLSLPAVEDDESAAPDEYLLRYEATRLFFERATAILPSFSLTRESALTIVQLCSRLDGIPLAIELAAARVKMLSI